MGHRVSTLSEKSSTNCTSSSSSGSSRPANALSRATVLAMIITVAAAASTGPPSYPVRPSTNLRTASSGASTGSCCFVAAEPAHHRRHQQSRRPVATAAPESTTQTGNRFRFRKRPLPSASSSSSSCMSSSLDDDTSCDTAPSGSSYSSPSTLGMRSSLEAHTLSANVNKNKRKGGIPLSSYRLGLRPQYKDGRSKPNTRKTGGGGGAGSGASRVGKARTIGDFPPHLAAALGPSAFSENGELILDDEEYERRKMEWAKRYTDVSTLRETFGTNTNQLWGDLDPETTRRLYHTLLPRALMGLYDMGLMRPHELAPLAYEARNAAKKYARERCIVPGRVFSMAYDGFRSLRDYGRWNHEGLSWEQVWDKYEQQIIDEFDFEDHEDDELTKQICLRILERSCRTNSAVDKMFLKDGTDVRTAKNKDDEAAAKRKQERLEMAEISAKLERDVHELLFEGAQKSKFFNPTREQKKKLKIRRRELRRAEIISKKALRTTEKAFLRALKNEDQLKRKEAERLSGETSNGSITSDRSPANDEESKRVKLTAQEVWLLRKLIGTKRRIRDLRAQTPLIKKIRQNPGATNATNRKANNRGETNDKARHHDDSESHKKEYGETLIEVSPRAKSILEKRPWLSRGRVLPQRNRATVHPSVPVRTEEVLLQ